MRSKKDQILDIALGLFLEKGFDETSISDIQNSLGIARGTLYYHFPSKEAIMDGIINRIARQVEARAKAILDSPELSVTERLFALFSSMNIAEITGQAAMLDYLHKPQNALLHEKSNHMLYESLSPYLAQILEQGQAEGLFTCAHSLYTAEMMLILGNTFLDEAKAEELPLRMAVLLHNVERMLGAKEGSLQELAALSLAR